VMHAMWLKSGWGFPRRERGGATEDERRSRLVVQQSLADAWDPQPLSPVPSPATASGSHVRLPTAALISAPLRWGSVGKHLFPRPPLLHLSGVATSACKQGGANCSSLGFYGTKAEQTNKLETFTQQPAKHSHSAAGDKCCQVPSAVIQARTHGSVQT